MAVILPPLRSIARRASLTGALPLRIRGSPTAVTGRFLRVSSFSTTDHKVTSSSILEMAFYSGCIGVPIFLFWSWYHDSPREAWPVDQKSIDHSRKIREYSQDLWQVTTAIDKISDRRIRIMEAAKQEQEALRKHLEYVKKLLKGEA